MKAVALAMAASGAESDGSDDSERYGGGRGSRDPDRVSTKDLPKWSAKRGDYPEWQWEAASIFEAAKLGDTMDGSNRSWLTSGDAKIKAKYKRKILLAFRLQLRMISRTTEEGRTLRMMIQDEFGEEHDGYLLGQYLNQYAMQLSPSDIKELKEKLRAYQFKAEETPEKWDLRMQQMLATFKRIPEGKRDMTKADLSDMLLDKMPDSCQTYVQYVQGG